MGIARLFFAAILLVGPGRSFSEIWITHVDHTHFFSVHFPSQPEVHQIPYQSEYGSIFPAYVYTAQNGQNFYSVTVVDFSDSEGIYREPVDKTDDDENVPGVWLYDQRGSVAYAARNFRLRGGEVTYDAWHHIDLVEGHQLQITNQNQSRTYAGMYLHNSRLYVLEATVPAGAPPQGLFQQSLVFLDEKGARIRYNLKPDGSRTRLIRSAIELVSP